MFSLAATPPAATRANTGSLPHNPTNFLDLSRLGGNTNGPAAVATLAEEALPPGVPLPPGAQFSLNNSNRQGGPLASGPTAGLPGFKGMPLPSSGGNLGNPVLANQQPAPPSPQQPAVSGSIPLASAPQSDWSIVNSPNDSTTPYFLDGVTCLSASDCWAVGRTSSVSHITIVERWDGSSWTVVPSPDGPGDLINILSGVACTATNDCWAVGYYVTQQLHVGTLILRWDGSSWTIVPSPDANPASRSALNGITCQSSSECWAVGFDATSGNVAQTLIERWDGSSWTVVASPSASTTEGNELLGVTCMSASDCWAVGSYVIDASTRATLTEHWDGSTWTIIASPNATGGQDNVLASVTCVSASDCWSVGYYSIDIVDPTGTAGTIIQVAQTLIERWDGNAWAIVSSPNPSVDNSLAGITCTSTTACWAVGYSSNSQVDSNQVDQSLILVWNGTVWLPGTTPGVPASEAQTLAGVTCASSSDCWIVGSLTSGWAKGLTEHWDGTSWSMVTAPKVDGRPSNFLYSVTCSSKSDCWAVGFWFASNVARTLIMRWDGSSWSIVPSPNVNDTDNHYLGGVTCVSASDCWAVGSRTDNIGLSARTLTLHWDGTSWSIVSSAPDTSTVQGLDLESVSCASTSECMAVGFTRGTAGDYGFAMRWDGSSWSVVPVPPTPEADMFYTPSEYLYGVTCPAQSDCWAVGAHWTGTMYRTLVDHWDGSTWTAATSPNTAADQDNILSGVTCVSSSNCWAVGSFDAYSQALIERWDGTSWSIVPSPQAGNPLNAVTCLSASDCWAAGPYYTPNPPAQTLLMHWDGTAWAKVVSPNTSAGQSNTLSGIACASSSDCWAVGDYSSRGSLQTLTLHYTPSPPIPTSVVSRKTHGTGGAFDIDLPLVGTPGIECRTGGSTNDYQVVLTFASAVTFDNATVTSGTGTVSNSSGSGTTEVALNLTGIANAQTITLTLFGVNDSTNSGDVSVPMSVLVGDSTANGNVSNTDVAAVKAEVAAPVTASNFRNDVNANGIISNTDVSNTKAQVGTSLP
jgi:hypothetical protein